MTYFLAGTDVCRAIDIGFGFVKFSKSHTKLDWGLDADAFPSLAPQAPAASDVGGGEQQRLNIAIVQADGAHYAVGPDAMLAAPGLFTRMLDNSFFRSPQYLALYRGALFHMNLPRGGVVDFMTVGLPFTVYQDATLRAEVVARLSGWHDLPPRPGATETQRVLVRRVSVIPQVMGSLLAQTMSTNAYQRIQTENNLTVDVGYGTMLWMVSAGLKADAARCGGNMGGVSSVLQAIATEIDPQLAHDPRILERLDRTLRDPAQPLKINGQPVALANYKKTAERVLAEWTSAMMRAIGRSSDIDNVFLSGGGAYLYAERLRAVFPGVSINVDEKGGRFTNLRGFQMAAERRAVDARSAPRAEAA